MIYNLLKIVIKFKGIEEDSNKVCNSKRDSHLVKDCHLPVYEDHLGAEGLKTSRPFRRHALCVVSGASYFIELMHNLGGTAVYYRPFGFSQRDFKFY